MQTTLIPTCSGKRSLNCRAKLIALNDDSRAINLVPHNFWIRRTCYKEQARNKDEWAKNRKRFARNSSEPHGDPSVACKHKEEGCNPCRATLLSPTDISAFHDKIYKHKTAADRNSFVFKYILTQVPKQHRPRKKTNPRSRTVTKYFIRHTSGRILNVCNQTFLFVTRFSRKRVNNLSKHMKVSGECPPERRGGARLKPRHTDI
ncbi:hypothetical protein PR048_027483 [Dryococelus australis]|uniref:Uncharacterized protein n=1 Tax=Dryococelus australis TaxID=614101 RepID=A0ABQ9GFK9_9NEOP|nr:hypothetical protein PR048_027483 [Dryococelus australis]